eukprot:jgi/Astpho2/3690/fgenesh1_pm.00060_%23_4_t
MEAATEERVELRRQLRNFLDQDHGHGEYQASCEKIKAVLTKENVEANRLRLEVDVNDLQGFDAEVHRRLMAEPGEVVPALEEGLDELIRHGFPKTLAEGQEVRVGFVGEFGPHRVSPRALTAHFISRLVSVEGIVTKASLVRPKVVRTVQYCEATKQFHGTDFRDVTSHDGLPTGAVYKLHDENNNPLSTEYGLCKYRNHQVITVQELPETAPAGQLPRSAEVIVEDDLVDTCKPGDRVNMIGIYKAIPPRANGTIQGTFRAVVVANAVKLLLRDASAANITADDIRWAQALSGLEPTVLEQLANSLAPSIYGHETIKKGLVLLLLGGRERNLANGHHLRGDINCLLVGDPGVAKSQLLRAVMNVSPLAISTTGRGSSGVGLTAAVTTDPDTGERRLEAGAMVLADRGVVCIDEFDKMSDIDRVAIHEVMEQQTVTIAKAGIQTQLNARCSVVAAANPLYGNYDHNISVTKNINLPDSLLSRFDLMFVVLDNMDEKRDKSIAHHVLGQHRYRQPGDDGLSTMTDAQDRANDELDGEASDDEGGAQARSKSTMYVKWSKELHGERKAGQKEPLNTTFLKKYFTVQLSSEYTITLVHWLPCRDLELSGEAMEAIGDFYSELRQTSDQRALPVTVRTLETVIRLSTAAARARLAKSVQQVDVRVAQRIMNDVLGGDEAVAADADAKANPGSPRAQP